MGKRVFEVAKDLGVDHRKVLESCDKLNISVRNYMSELSDSDEARLRRDFESGRKVVERVQAPGVVRRRRRAPTRDAGGARPGAPAVRTPVGVGAVKTRRRVGASASEAPPASEVVEAKVEKPEPAAPPPSAPVEPATPVEAPVVEAAEAAPAKADEAATVVEEQAAQPVAKAEAESVAEDATAVAPAASEAETSADAAPAPNASPAKPAPAKPAPSGSAVVIRPPAPREGGAKILGSIPLEQLQQRTVQPRRSGPPGGRRGPGGAPNRRPGGGPPRPGGPRLAPGAPPPGGAMPPAADAGRRRRGAPPDKGGATGDRKRGAAAGQQKTARRRRVFNRDEIYRGGSGPRNNRGRKRKMSSRKGLKTQITTPAAHKRVVRIDETIRVGEFAKALGVKASEIIRQLMGMDIMATLNDEIDFDTATLLAGEYEYEVSNIAFDESEFLSAPSGQDEEEIDPDAELRAPVVTIMGHVDHGKTTLLDSIRSASVVDGEAGGITQHIGAYKVPVGDLGVVFLDTPGHAAFTSMRARGASVTDVVVLIVAADDGVMPQTEESINHAKAAGVPIIVAVNKCDKPDIDPERIKQELTQFDLVPEEWGGENMFVNISALKGTGIDDLLEALALQAEVLELRANPKNPAFGSVIEARVDKGRGTVCTVLVQEGTLKKGDYVVAGSHYGRVRALTDDNGKAIKEAGPSTPVEVLGLNGVPSAGDAFYIVKNERDARKVVSERSNKARTAADNAKGPSPMDIFAAMGQPEKETQNVILKADVSGSYEAIKASLEELSTDEVEVRLLHGGVGAITESDVDLATASNAVIIGFNAIMDGKAKRSAEREGVRVVRHSIIYELIDVVKDLMSGLLSPETIEERLGRAEVRAVFHIQKVGTVAGCFVTDGKVQRGAHARVFRDGEEIHAGKLSTLKRFKDDVKEVSQGYECGLFVDGYKGITEGDEIEVFEIKEIQRTID